MAIEEVEEEIEHPAATVMILGGWFSHSTLFMHLIVFSLSFSRGRYNDNASRNGDHRYDRSHDRSDDRHSDRYRDRYHSDSYHDRYRSDYRDRDYDRYSSSYSYPPRGRDRSPVYTSRDYYRDR